VRPPQCPPGAHCAGFINGEPTLPSALTGWYNLNGSALPNSNATLFSLCPDARGDPARADATCLVPCEPPEACIGGNLCDRQYVDKGPLYRCSACAVGYFRQNGACVGCPQRAWLLIVLFFVMAVVLCVGGWLLNRKNVNIAFLSIGVDYFQVLAMFATAKVKWPAVIVELFRIMSVFNFNVDITAPECTLQQLTYETKWWIVMGLPLGAAVVFALIFTVNVAVKRLVKGVTGRRRLMSHMNALVGMMLVVMYFLYLYLTRTVLDMFNCSPTVPPDGHEYLQVVFVRCGTGLQARLLPFAAVFLVLYTIGYPALVAYIVFKHRLLIMEDQVLRAKDLGDTRLSNPHCYDLRKKFQVRVGKTNARL
jgi:hypothetical protein